MVAGLNAQLRTVQRGSLRSSLMPVVNWLNTHANVKLSPQGVRVDLAWYQATASGYYQIGLLLNAADEVPAPMPVLEMPSPTTSPRSMNYTHVDQEDLFRPPPQWQFTRGYSQLGSSRRRVGGAVLDAVSLRSLEYRRDLLFPLSLIFRNSRPVGHQATVGLVISLLLLVDISLTLLMLLQFYSISLEPMLVVLLVPPLASVLPSAAGLNALFSHGPPRSAGLARVYALWNLTSFTNLVSIHTPTLCHFSF
jgi:hypothetical protein